MAAFLTYVDSTWIGAKNPRTKLRKRPMFAHRMWNKYRATLENTPNTNNPSEGYNMAFNVSLPAQPSEWVLLNRFKTEESISRAKLHQAATVNQLDKTSNARVLAKREKDLRLRNLVSNFKSLTPQAYMESLETFFEV